MRATRDSTTLLPDPSTAIAQKGYYLALVGQLAAAMEEYARAIEANPAQPQAYFGRACAQSLHETAGTIADDLRRAIRLLPQMRLLAAGSGELEWARQHLPAVRGLLADT